MKLNKQLFIFLISVMMLEACNSEPKEIQLIDLRPEEVKSAIASAQKDGKAVLVNLWGTWCIPCVEEFPYIMQLKEKYHDKLNVMFISVDFPEDRQAAIDFLKSQNVTWDSYLKTGSDEPFINAVSPNWMGGVPFTAIYNSKGEKVTEWEGAATFKEFEERLQKALN